jgi:hypothetical protein
VHKAIVYGVKKSKINFAQCNFINMGNQQSGYCVCIKQIFQFCRALILGPNLRPELENID